MDPKGPRGLVRRAGATPELLQRAKALRQSLTPAERCFWNAVRAGRLEGLHFRRQQPVGPFIADFYCHALGLVVELDGGVHDRQAARDAERDAYLASRGLTVLRIRNELVLRDLPRVRALLLSLREQPLLPSPTGEGPGERANPIDNHPPEQ